MTRTLPALALRSVRVKLQVNAECYPRHPTHSALPESSSFTITSCQSVPTFGKFIEGQVDSGRFASASEVVRASLRLLEERDEQLAALRTALKNGEKSGSAGPIDIERIKQDARGAKRRRA